MQPTWKMRELKKLALKTNLTKEERSAVLWAIATIETRRRTDAQHTTPVTNFTHLSSETRS